MKTIVTLLTTLFFVYTLSFAQDSIFIYKSGELLTKCQVTQIDSITFKSSTLLVQLPVVTSTVVSNIEQNIATSGGNVTYDGGGTILKRGICWDTNPVPTTSSGTKTTETGTTGSFTSSMTGLTANTTYYMRAYATNSAGTAYGNEQTFRTKAVDTGFGGVSSQYISNGIAYALHTFNYDANFYPPTDLTHARVLLVGAGGNGGGTVAYEVGGGGGGGQVKEGDVAIAGNSMPVTISVGGTTITSFGGQSVINGSTGLGGNGGNGGISGNGKDGGIGLLRAGGGGGGGSYGFDGVPNNFSPMGGNGGDGIMNDITGVSTYYGGGGGGGSYTNYNGKIGLGGLGGGGGWGTIPGMEKGAPNTGGGGCGAQYSSGGGSRATFLVQPVDQVL